MMLKYFTEFVEGFEVHTLESPILRVSLIPELGGKIVSIYDRQSHREWLDGWQPESERRLWKPRDPKDFETSCGSGIDECLPTVLACRVGDAALPDHGDLWSSPAELDASQAHEGVLTCLWKLGSLPLVLQRSLTLHHDKIHLHYRLQNLAEVPTPFLWAWHPLFTLKDGDQIHFEPEVQTCLSGGDSLPWPVPCADQDLSRGDVGDADPPCAKVFVGPLSQGNARICGLESTLQIQWPADLFPWAGIWITRGAWKGLHHWAIEPTNCPVDSLSEASFENPLNFLSGNELREWELVVCSIADQDRK